MPTVFVKPRVEKTNAVIQLALELGEFRMTSGCAFDVEWVGVEHTLKVTYWQDETFTALRLKFGHMFTEDPTKPKPLPKKPPVVALPPTPKRRVRPLTSDDSPYQWVEEEDWKKMIWQLQYDADERESAKDRLDDSTFRRLVTSRYA